MLRIHQPVHGYDVRQELLRWRVHEWGQVHPGSICHQLGRLTRDGFLQITDVERRGSGPARTCYRLTPRGEEEFRALLQRQLWTVGHRAEDSLVGLCFLPFVTWEEAIAAMESRASQPRAIERGMASKSSPEHVAEIVRLTAPGPPRTRDGPRSWPVGCVTASTRWLASPEGRKNRVDSK